MNLLPFPRLLRRRRGHLEIPEAARNALGQSLDWPSKAAEGFSSLRPSAFFRPSTFGPRLSSSPALQISQTAAAPLHPEGYELEITQRGIALRCREDGGLRAGMATLRQLVREYGHRLPRLLIRDHPDFPRRGVMLDISRGRVPNLRTLLGLVEHLADFKINEFQLYTEHTFAYRKYRPVWRGWGALTARQIRVLDRRCRELGIDLVPNQNSFGHMRSWLEHGPLKRLAETAEPFEDANGAFLRYPSTLAPNHPGTLPFLRGLYQELLPNFSSGRFNVGCDETWDLGRGQTRRLCGRKGKGRVYLEFLKAIHREVSKRDRLMMFWGDIILKYPNLIRELPRNAIALDWGYEAKHPFAIEARVFSKAGLDFYVCPGTSTWMTLVGRLDNALANLRSAAGAGLRHGAAGYLVTDWGDGGHPQPLAVSYLPYLAGAALSWCGKTFDERRLGPVLNRDVFLDPNGEVARAAFRLGLAHRKLQLTVPNSTPLGTVIAAPRPKSRELFCRDGLKCFEQLPPKRIRAALNEIERQRTILLQNRPKAPSGKLLAQELDMAARMAAASCRFMLWQQAIRSGKTARGNALARSLQKELSRLEAEFKRYWPKRNAATSKKCIPFLRWRLAELKAGRW